MADQPRAKLPAFEVSVRRNARIKWAAGGTLGPDDRIDVGPGMGDILELRHAPSRRFLGREPVHESLLIELVQPLATAPLGVLKLGRIVYRAGTDRLAYQATQAVATLSLVESTPDRRVIDAAITLINPDLDTERAGSHALAGLVIVPGAALGS